MIVGGGYAGFYTAWNLEKRLRHGEAEVVVIDPLPYMTYQPFLPEVMAGSVEPRHALVSPRRHLHRTELLSATVTRVDHARKTVTVQPAVGDEYDLDYDIVVVTAGAVTRTFPIPGVKSEAIGLKTIEEAVAVRDRLLANFDRAAALQPGPDRQRLLTATFVGGGFAGVEGFGELLSLATALLGSYPELSFDELDFRLVEATGRILPEVSEKTGRWVVESLEDRGGRVHLNTQLVSAVDGHVALSTGEEFDSDLIVWTAGTAANPVVARHTDLPVDDRGSLVVKADLRVRDAGKIVVDAWGAGDNAAVPDVSRTAAQSTTVPNAQHAVRQGKRLAKNLVASLRGELPHDYVHANLGVVATLGLYTGVFQSGPFVVKGFPAWVMHRGYHVLAIPTWERKVRVLAAWILSLVLGRDIVSLEQTQHPRDAFERVGARR
ncbi:FAD-dependent oxidoreductase [Conyzicola nivalis]|uniref:Dehydrogenase n=1 Tax=Conyzicola nivalis TaxID=1477021 RepID=A0A916SEJ7_9MICO|nr:dehydrogenase [Conyzicola nivalis]